jgi:septum formation inhibitor-activating ATPase MinD
MITSAAETALFGMDIHRDAAAVVRDRDRLIGVYGHHDPVAKARQRLVYRVVDNLENHMVQTTAVIGVTDVHPGSFAHCIKAL